ncbi:TIGR02391 family protein [Mycolicibacterium wolinskyi]|uniref:TIGR02391 family protein n=1 Tax=Mycolicibacterium wolinskyi TaxID=59750 RepID=UPI00391786C0
MADPERNPTYLRELAKHVEEFRDAFSSFLELHTPTYRGPGMGMVPAISPLDGTDPTKIEALRARVSEAAGRARRAPHITGCVIGVARPGSETQVVDPIAAWQTVTQPKPMLEPSNILDACNQMIGSLEEMADRALAELPPTVDVSEMHPAVWGQAARLWRDEHYRQAVAAGAEGVLSMVKSRTGRYDIPDTALWQQVFSDQKPEPGKPRLRWPGDPTHQTVVSMNAGLRQFAPGAQMTIRNPATHGLGEMTPQEAAERLSTLSLLARWVDQCDLLEADPPAGTQ